MKNHLFPRYFLILTIMLSSSFIWADPSEKGLFDFYTNKAKIVATKIETRNIAQMIYLDYISGIEIPMPEQLPNYIRKRNRSPYGHNRDTAFDFWNNLYLLSRDAQGFKVISKGPDGYIDTEDDIVYGHYLD